MDNEILDFWFNEIDQSLWWNKDAAFDQLIRDRFSELHRQANRCELFTWRKTAKGRLAEVIVLDQFSAHIYRGEAAAHSSDPLALALAQEAVAVGADKELSPIEKSFLYLPYMHSESLPIHDIALELYKQPGLERALESEIRHREIVERFGRYPHRNVALGIESTAEEIEFLKTPGSSF